MTEQLKYIILDNETFTPVTGGREDYKFNVDTVIEIANEMIDECSKDNCVGDSNLPNVQTIQQAIETLKDFSCLVFPIVEDTLEVHKEVLKNMLLHDKYFQIRFQRGSTVDVATVEPLAVVGDNLTFQIYRDENDDTLEYLTAPLCIAEDLPQVIRKLVQAHYNAPVKHVLICK